MRGMTRRAEAQPGITRWAHFRDTVADSLAPML
jgi:hypothetical protein